MIKTEPEAHFDVTTYIAISKKSAHSTPGFRRWIRSRKVRRMTKAEWDVLWHEYMTAPAGK